MTRQLTLLIMLCWPWLINCSAISRQLTMEEWSDLRSQRTAIADKKFAATDSLASLINHGVCTADSANILMALELGKIYTTLHTDSAFRYFSIAKDLAEQSGSKQFSSLAQAYYLSIYPLKNSTGADVIERFKAIDPDVFTDTVLKTEYLTCAYKLYYQLEHYAPMQNVRANATRLRESITEAINTHLSDTVPISQILKGIEYSRDGKDRLAVASYLTALDNCNGDKELYYNSCLLLARSYLNTNNLDMGLQYALRATILELETGRLSGTGMMILSDILLSLEHIPQAYDCIQDAFDNTIRANNILGSVAASDHYYRLNKVYGSYYIKRQNTILGIAIVLLLLMLLDMTLYIIYRIKKKDPDNTPDSNTTGSHDNNDDIRLRMLTEYLGFYSDYLDSIEEFQTLARRKIISGQADDIVRQIKTSVPIGYDPDRFLINFDKAFLEIYPDFVEELNSMLHADKQLELTDPKHLTNEIRVYAFMRMGISDSASIARFLNVSVNTVYTYRNKMRTRAVERDSLMKMIRGENFEEETPEII